MKILIMGLPGAGKTWLAERLMKHIENCAFYNADVIRHAANDWDFSASGRLRQCNRMKTIADFEILNGRNVICDFVAPTNEIQQLFAADKLIWLDTIEESRFENTNKIFEPPSNVDIHIQSYLSDNEIELLVKQLWKT